MPPHEYTRDWFSDNERHLELCRRILDRHDAALEVGAFEGRSTVWLLQHYGHVDTIDNFKGGDEHNGIDMASVRRRFENNVAEYGDRLSLHVGDSAPILASLVSAARLFDFIYIDGSHRCPDVLADAVLAWRLLRPGGIMVFDDYLFGDENGPRGAIDFFMLAHWNEMNVIYRGYQVSVQRI